jgi:glycosyltransferase involved in cell wall biosynthesis
MSKPLHVIHVAKVHVAEYQGGPALTIHLLLKAQEQIRRPGLAMSAVFCDKVARSYQDLIPKMRSPERHSRSSFVQRIALSIFPRTFRFCIGIASRTLTFLFHFEWAVRRMDKNEDIVFHIHDLAYLPSRRYHQRYPIIFTVHGLGGYIGWPMQQFPVFKGTFVEKLWRRVETTVVKCADIITFPSRGAQAVFESEYPGLLQGKDVRIVHSGVDTAELDSVTGDATLLAKYSIGQDTPVVLCVGALREDKGVDTLVEAIASLPEDVRSRLSCLVVGRGHLEGELQSLIAERGLQDKVKLLGFLPRQELLQLMKVATIFALPSLVSIFDYVLLEAGAMGLPIVTSAVGGNLEMFDEDSALLVPPEEPQALAAAITRVLTDGELRKQLSESVYHRVRSKFSLESMFNSYLAIYEEMAKRYGDRSWEGKKSIT